MAALFSAVTNWLLFAGLVAGLGAVAAWWVFIPRAASSLPEGADVMRVSAGSLVRLAGTALPVALVLAFARQLREFRDPFAPWTEDASLLIGTEWGRTWMLALAISLLATLGSAAARRGAGAGWWLCGLTLVPLAAYPAFSGHASGTGGLAPLTIAGDVLHVLAAGAWVGGLAFVLRAERAWRSTGAGDGSSLLPVLVPVFSPVAVVSVVALWATGLCAAWVHLSSVADLVATPYGRLLALKLVIVAVVMALGAVNWRRLTPRLGEEAGRAALRENATRELLLAHAVLLVTAVLVRTSPMGP